MSKPADTVIATHRFVFNPRDNGGESLSLTTKFISNGDEGAPNLYYNQTLELQSYCNVASISLFGASITPDVLRKLADELEKAEAAAQEENK